MSCVHMMAAFDALAAGRVPGGAATALVLLKIANRADENGVCWPSLDRLASDTGLGRRTVERAVAELVASGLVRKETRRDGAGKAMSNVYHLDIALAERQAERQAERHPDARIGQRNQSIRNPSKRVRAGAREGARAGARDSLGRGMVESGEGITHSPGDARDAAVLASIRQHPPAAIARAVEAARRRDSLGRAFPSAVWRELRRAGEAGEDLPPWARVVGEHLAPAPPEACEEVCDGFQALGHQGGMV